MAADPYNGVALTLLRNLPRSGRPGIGIVLGCSDPSGAPGGDAWRAAGHCDPGQVGGGPTDAREPSHRGQQPSIIRRTT